MGAGLSQSALRPPRLMLMLSWLLLGELLKYTEADHPDEATELLQGPLVTCADPSARLQNPMQERFQSSWIQPRSTFSNTSIS